MTAPAFTRVISIDAPPEAFAQLPAVQAMIGAVMEEAAKMIEPSVPDCECLDCAKCEMYAADIRALHHDALTALEAYRQRVRDETLDEVLRLQPYDHEGFKSVHQDPHVFVSREDVQDLKERKLKP